MHFIKKENINILIVATITMFYFINCASNRINLLKDKAVTIEKVTSGNVSISNIFVYQNGNSFEISGKVTKRTGSPFVDGHIDIAIIEPDGNILKKPVYQQPWS